MRPRAEAGARPLASASPTLVTGKAKVIPEATAPHMTLMTAMAAMCYLAVLAIGALLMTSAARILRDTPGISGATVVPAEDARRLLEPWLGKSAILDDLPIPQLINVSIDKAIPPDLEGLRARLAAEVPSATLDTHRRWQAELISMAGTLTWLAIAVLSLIAGAAAVLVVYATRAAMEANREVLEVLYLAGARDSFISREVLWRFCLTGLKAGLIGALLGFITFILLGFGSGRLAGPVKDFLYHPLGASSTSYAAILAVPVVATVISLITARISISRVLKAMF
jgi:cell division transport system permease protein